MSLKDDLIAAKALIDTPEKWCKEVNSYVRDGVVISRCAIGAISACTSTTPSAFHAARDALLNALPDGETEMVSMFNDRYTTTHADIMALFDRAITAATEPTS